MSEIREQLEEQIIADLEAIGKEKTFGSDERKQMINDLDKLYRLYLDDLKNEADITDSGDRLVAEEKQRKIDNEYREEQKIRDKFDKIVGHALTGLGIVLPAGVSVWMMLKGWQFEETGTICSSMMKWLMNRQRLTK